VVRGDGELLGAVARGGGGAAGAFGELFERYGDFVYNVAFRRTASWAAAEDLTSIVFLELWRQRRRVDVRGGSLRPWLVAVTINQVKRDWGRQSRQRALRDRWPRPQPEEDHADAVATRLDDEHRMRRLHDALADLPEAHRDVLTLWAWEGLGYEEIAAALGLPVGTVRSRLHRARARLRTDQAESTEGTAAAPPAYLVESSTPATDGTPSGRREGGRP
jgi:RNA polymerase sigma factor (sigma-70 family)